MKSASIRLPFAVACVLATFTAVAVATSPARAAEFFVANSNASCSSTGPGTAAAPYCTITAALAAHHEAGTIITVLPGVYREQVTFPASGLAGSPLTVRAQAGSQPVVVDGTDDFSDPALWSQSSGDVWVAASVTTAPVQVFADDARLTPSTAAPSALPPRSFTFVAGSGLFVNAGGGNPATHHTQVGRRTNGFFASAKSFVVIQGFTVRRAESRCIQLTNSANVEVLGNHLESSGKFGLQLNGEHSDHIAANVVSNSAGHGISCTNGTTGCTFEDNESFGNVDPAARTANGLFLTGSPGNVIRRNRWHDNQDTGQGFITGSNDNVSVANQSWHNGDHGYDHLGSTGNLHVDDVAYANHNDGFSIEGNATGQQLFNCIAIENGTTTNEYDLFVDTTSTAGLQSNDNVLWNSGPQPPVKISHSVYSSVSSYSAGRQQDSRTVQADPRFVNPAAGDFHLSAGSSAIDNANSGVANWPSTDADGHARVDDPGTPNRGTGPVTFADRGACEFLGSSAGNQPPVARLTATPSSGTAPLAVKLDASASSDADGQVVSYFFEFGDGNTVGPQASAIANHTYAAGQRTARVTVTDNQGAKAGATAAVNATPPASNAPPVARLTATPNSGTAPLAVSLDASASSDPDGHVVSYRFDFGDGASVGPQSGATASHTYAAGHWTATVKVTDDGGATATASAAVDAAAPPSNLVGNASFEVNLDGWAAIGGAGLVRVSGGHQGLVALLAAAPTLSLSPYGITDQPDWVQNTPAVGTRYHFQAWVRAEVGAGLASLRVRETAGGQVGPTVASSAVTLSLSWTSLDLDYTTRFAASSLDLDIVNQPALVGTAFRIDDISILETSTPPLAGVDPGSDPALTAPGVHPNPMRADGARIVFSTSRPGETRIAIFDLAGRVVRSLAGDPAAGAGVQFVAFDGRNDDGGRLPGGIYYYQVRSPDGVHNGRLVILN